MIPKLKQEIENNSGTLGVIKYIHINKLNSAIHNALEALENDINNQINKVVEDDTKDDYWVMNYNAGLYFALDSIKTHIGSKEDWE